MSIEVLGGGYVWHNGQGRERWIPRYHSVERTKAKPGLEVWKNKRLATAIASSESLAALALEDPYAAVKAVDAEASYESLLGISVHTVTAELDNGHSRSFSDEELTALIEPGVEPSAVRPY